MSVEDEIKMFCGIPVTITDCITKKVRARRHHKKRIDKKWLKRYGYKNVPNDTELYVMTDAMRGKTLIMTKKCYEKITGGMKNEML